MKSDAQIQQDVWAELAGNPALNAAQIVVRVRYGIVTLSGHVDSLAEKWDVERAGRCISGVKALVVAVDVNLSGAGKRQEARVARSA